MNLQQVEDESESIDAVENLLESYFMQVDSAYDRLVSVGDDLASLMHVWRAREACCLAREAEGEFK